MNRCVVKVLELSLQTYRQGDHFVGVITDRTDGRVLVTERTTSGTKNGEGNTLSSFEETPEYGTGAGQSQDREKLNGFLCAGTPRMKPKPPRKFPGGFHFPTVAYFPRRDIITKGR